MTDVRVEAPGGTAAAVVGCIQGIYRRLRFNPPIPGTFRFHFALQPQGGSVVTSCPDSESAALGLSHHQCTPGLQCGYSSGSCGCRSVRLNPQDPCQGTVSAPVFGDRFVCDFGGEVAPRITNPRRCVGVP